MWFAGRDQHMQVRHRECCSMSRKAKSSFSAWGVRTAEETQERIGTRRRSRTRTGICCSPLHTSLPTVTSLPCVFLLLVALQHAPATLQAFPSPRAHADRAAPPAFKHRHPPTSSPASAHASCRSSCSRPWLCAAATDTEPQNNTETCVGPSSTIPLRICMARCLG